MAEAVSGLLRAVGRVPSGIFVVTVGVAGTEGAGGMMASLVQQVSLAPVCVGVAVRKGRGFPEVMQKGGRFVLNVCHAGEKGLLRHFAKASRRGAGAFEGVRTEVMGEGTVLSDACAYMSCRVREVVEFGGDHVWVIAEVEDGGVMGKEGPMVHVRHDGGKY